MGTSVLGKDPRPSRMSAAAFIVAFGALVILCVVLTVGVVTYETGVSGPTSTTSTTTGTTGTGSVSTSGGTSSTASSSTTSPAVTTITGSDGSTTISREPKPTPPNTNKDQVNATIQPHLIAEAKSTRTYTGVAVTGKMTDYALANPGEFTTHVGDLLAHNCLDSMALTTPRNVRVSFTGFCYTALPPRTMERMLTYALDGKVDEIDFSNYPARGNKNHVTMTWFTDSATKAAHVQKSWNSLRRPHPIDQIALYTYEDDKVTQVIKSRGNPDSKRVDPMIGDRYEKGS